MKNQEIQITKKISIKKLDLYFIVPNNQMTEQTCLNFTHYIIKSINEKGFFKDLKLKSVDVFENDDTFVFIMNKDSSMTKDEFIEFFKQAYTNQVMFKIEGDKNQNYLSMVESNFIKVIQKTYLEMISKDIKSSILHEKKLKL